MCSVVVSSEVCGCMQSVQCSPTVNTGAEQNIQPRPPPPRPVFPQGPKPCSRNQCTGYRPRMFPVRGRRHRLLQTVAGTRARACALTCVQRPGRGVAALLQLVGGAGRPPSLAYCLPLALPCLGRCHRVFALPSPGGRAGRRQGTMAARPCVRRDPRASACLSVARGCGTPSEQQRS